MLWRKLHKSKPLMAVVAALLAVTVFATPQGICLNTLLGDSQCCKAHEALVRTAESKAVKACCAAHCAAEPDASDTSSRTPEQPGCMWTSDAAYLVQGGLDLHDVVAVEPIALAWIDLLDVQLQAALIPSGSRNSDPDPLALRRGSSILRI